MISDQPLIRVLYNRHEKDYQIGLMTILLERAEMPDYSLTWISDSIAVGRAPMSYAEFDSIKAGGIDAIVNLCAEFSDLHELEETAGFEVYYLPIWDEDIPSMEDMEEALAWLDEAVYLGKKILVHCRHGIGRTGTFVISYMIRRGIGLKAAKKKLKSSNANPSSYGQWKLLKKYGKKSGILKIREPSLEIKTKVDLNRFFFDYESLIQDIDKRVSQDPEAYKEDCGSGESQCCYKSFYLQLIEVLYLYSNINRYFTSAERQIFIERSVSVLKADHSSAHNKILCPFNDGSKCRIYDIRPARCRIYGIKNFSSDRHEINSMLFELSSNVFLAFSGQFLSDTSFIFPVTDIVSGKFVQKYFDYMAAIKRKKQPEHS